MLKCFTKIEAKKKIQNGNTTKAQVCGSHRGGGMNHSLRSNKLHFAIGLALKEREQILSPAMYNMLLCLHYTKLEK